MLSPSISTRSNGTRPCAATIWRARSYCTRSPVPLSPMTAKVTASARARSGASDPTGAAGAADVSSSSGTIATRRMARLRSERRRRPRRAEPPVDARIGGRDAVTLGDAPVHGRDEPARGRLVVAAGAKRIHPLGVAQPVQQIAGPLYFFRRNPLLEQLLVPPVIRELHVA